MKDAILRFRAQNKKQGLLLINWPTGRGKTYNAVNTILQMEYGFFVSPLIKNVNDAYGDAKKYCERYSISQERFLRDSIVLRPNYEAVLEHFDEVETHLPSELTSLETFKALSAGIKFYKSSHSNELFLDPLKKAEKEFRRQAGKILRYRFKGKPLEIIKMIRADSQWSCLIKLYPAMECVEKKYFFMTMMKFYQPIDTLIESPFSFVDSPLTKNRIVFLDEFDACKADILKALIEESLRKSIGDVFGLRRRLEAALQLTVNPEFFINGEVSDKINNHYLYEGFIGKFGDRKKEGRLHLDFDSKGFDQTPRGFIYKGSDGVISDIRCGKEGVKLCVDQSGESINYIHPLKKDDKEKKLPLGDAISMAESDIRFFANGIAMAAKNHLTSRHDLEAFSVTDAIFSTLGCFSMSDDDKKTLFPLVINSFRNNESLNARVIKSFYEDGFTLNSVIKTTSDRFRVSVRSIGMTQTPETYLLSLAKHSFVIGLSATAKVPTPVGNFALDYLKESLGEQYYLKLPAEEAKRIRDGIKERMKDYRPDVNVHFARFEGKEGNVLALENMVKDSGSLEFIKSKLLAPLITGSGADKDFDKKRVLKVLAAITDFLCREETKALLVLRNSGAKLEGGYSVEMIQNCLKEIEATLPFLAEYEVIALQSADFDKEKNRIGEVVREGKKVIVLSTYATVGTGQNLQYLDENGKETDLDSIYLEYPRNLIPSLSSFEGLSEEERNTTLLKGIYEVEAICQTNLITEQEAKKAISAYMAAASSFGKARYGNELNCVYRSRNASLHAISVLVQGIGRISRVPKKDCVEHIYLDDEIRTNVNFKCVDSSDFVEEFQSVICACGNSFKENDRPLERQAAVNRANRCRRDIGAFLNSTNVDGAWSESKINIWTDIRDHCARHITVPKEQCDHEKPRFYLEFASGSKGDHYYYEASEENRETIDDIAFAAEDLTRPICVDENYLRLPYIRANPQLRGYMEKYGYPVVIEPNECMLHVAAIDDLWKGRVGEVLVQETLNDCGVELEEIRDRDLYEKFDFLVSKRPDIGIDAKNWSDATAMDALGFAGPKLIEKVEEKLSSTDIKKVIIIRLFGDDIDAWRLEGDGTILIIPALFCKNIEGVPLHAENMRRIMRFLEEK